MYTYAALLAALNLISASCYAAPSPAVAQRYISHSNGLSNTTISSRVTGVFTTSFSTDSSVTSRPTAYSSTSTGFSAQSDSNHSSASISAIILSTASAATTSEDHVPSVASGPNGSVSNSSNQSCHGIVLNAPSATLDYWWSRVYQVAISTFVVPQYSPSWTLFPARTSFNVTSALAASSVYFAGPEPSDFRDANASFYDISIVHSTSATPVFAATTVVTRTAFQSVNGTRGALPVPSPQITVAPASFVIPAPMNQVPLTAYFGTPVVYGTDYVLDYLQAVTDKNGNITCSTSRAHHELEGPFAFAYTGPNPDGRAYVTGDVPNSLLQLIANNSATAGRWTAVPTLIVVEEDIYGIESIGVADSQSYTSVSYLTASSALQLTVALSSARPALTATNVMTSEKQFQVPDNTPQSAQIEHTEIVFMTPTAVVQAPIIISPDSGQSYRYVAQLGTSQTTFDALSPTDGTNTLATEIQGSKVIATAIGTAKASSGGSINVDPGSQHGSSDSGSPGAGPSTAKARTTVSAAQEQDQASTFNYGTASSSTEESTGAGSSTEQVERPVITKSPSLSGIIAAVMGFVGYQSSQEQINSEVTYMVDGHILDHGSAAVTISSGKLLSVAADGKLVIDQQTLQMEALATTTVTTFGVAITVAPATPSVAPLLLALGSSTFTANAAFEFYISPSQTLGPGHQITYRGTTVSLDSSATVAVINSLTHTLSSLTTPAPCLTVRGTVYEPNTGSTYRVGGSDLTPGGVVTASGTTIGLATDGLTITVDGKTQIVAPFASSLTQHATSTITAPPILTIDNYFFTAAAPGSNYLVSGRILTPGGTVTIPGPNGPETISLDSSARVLIDGLSGATTTIAMDYTIGPATAVAAVLTIDDETFTALPGPEPKYLIDRQTLSPGGTITATIEGTVVTVTLSPRATQLIIQGGGKVTTETLFPATPTAAGTSSTAVSKVTPLSAGFTEATIAAATTSPQHDQVKSGGSRTGSVELAIWSIFAASVAGLAFLL